MEEAYPFEAATVGDDRWARQWFDLGNRCWTYNNPYINLPNLVNLEENTDDIQPQLSMGN